MTGSGAGGERLAGRAGEEDRAAERAGDREADVEGETGRPLLVFALLVILLAILLSGASAIVGRLRQPVDVRPLARPGETSAVAPEPTGLGTGAPPTRLACLGASCPGAAPVGAPASLRVIAMATAGGGGRGTRTPVATRRPLPTMQPAGVPVALVPGLQGPPLVGEVVAAYLRHWEVRTAALYNLDPAQLAGVLAEPELGLTAAFIALLKGEGRALRLDVDHRLTIRELTEDMAVIEDELFNRTVYVSAGSGSPLPSPAPGPRKLTYRMRKADGVWKVAEVLEASPLGR